MNHSARPAARAVALAAATLLVVALPALTATLPLNLKPARAPRMGSEIERDALASADGFIVRFRTGSAEHNGTAQRERVLATVGAAQDVGLKRMRTLATGDELVAASHPLDPRAAKRLLLALASDPAVEHAEIDRPVRLQALPNANEYAEQWYIQDHRAPVTGFDLRVPQAWAMSSGAGVVVAVVDSGITAHPDLDAHVLPGYDFVADAGRANDGDGRDADATDPGDGYIAGYNCPAPPHDSTWHGTEVAGVIAASANLQGIAGIAYDAQLVPVRVVGLCSGKLSDLVDGIVWAAGGTVTGVPANPHPAEVINVSAALFGACSSTTQAAIDLANAAGAVVVAAAGNDGGDTATRSPASCAGVVTVSGSLHAGGMFPTSNYGAAVDVLAPDEWILTTSNNGLLGPNGAIYTSPNGTSLSAATVSGVAALMQGSRPHSPAFIENALRLTARPDFKGCGTSCGGASLVDASRAVMLASAPVLYLDDPAPAAEGNADRALTFTARLTEPMGAPVTFKVATGNGTAIAGSDYVAPSLGTLTIPAGGTSVSFDVTVKGDAVGEGNEDFYAELTDIAGIAGFHERARAVLRNDDLTLLETPATVVVPSGTSATPMLYIVDVAPGTSRLDVRLAGGTGDADLYVRKGAPPTRAVNDCASAAVGNAEQCLVAATPGIYYVMVDTLGSQAGVSLSANQATPISIEDAWASEAGGPMMVRVSRPVAGEKVTFTLQFAPGGTAVAGQDYQATFWGPAEFAIPAGATSAEWQVPLSGTTDTEEVETFKVALANVANATVADGEGTYTIADSRFPRLDFITTNAEGTEAGGLLVQVLLSDPAPAPVSIQYQLVAGTATAGYDFTSQVYTAYMAPNEQMDAITLPLVNDAIAELDEQVTVRIVGVDGAYPKDRDLTYTIHDDDQPAIAVADAAVAEGNAGLRALAFTATLSAPTAYPVTYTIRTVPGSATPATDYLPLVATDTIPAGMVAHTFVVPVVGDVAIESNETVHAVIDSPIGATLGRSDALGTINNDDGGTLAISDASITEGHSGTKNLAFTVSLSQAAAAPVSFNLNTSSVGASATPGVDYDARPVERFTIPAGQLAVAYSVVVRGDTVGEPNEQLFVQLSDPAGASVLDGQGAGTILDDDGVVPTLSINDASVNEGDAGSKTLSFTVTLSQPWSVPVTFTAATAPGTATSPADFGALNQSGITIPAGVTSKLVNVQVIGDALVEPLETFTVNLTAANGANIADGQGTGYIINNDGALISVNDVAVAEGDAGTKLMTFTVSLSQVAPGPVSYNITSVNGDAAAGSDYAALNLANQVIPQGQLSKTHSVTINGDTTIEPTEVLLVNVRQPQGASVWDGQGTGYILNDDGPTLSILDAGVVEGNSGYTTMRMTVKLSQAAAVPVSYTIFTTGNYGTEAPYDFVALNTTGTIPAGELSTVQEIQIVGDNGWEQNEQFLVTLKDPVGASVYDRQAIAWIYNDDGPTLSVGDISLNEGNAGTTTATFTVKLSEAVGHPVWFDIATANGTATAGSDYVAKASTAVQFAAGETSKAFTVTVNGDTTAEANETFKVNVTNLSAGTILRGQATATIFNDD